jgi:type I restriction enzyme, S subunit
LKLAVRGQIVRQDPSDEPADDLIAHIQTEKQSVERRGKPSIQLGAIHDIPQTWRWVRFGDVTMNRDGERIPVSKEERSARAKVYDYYGASGVIDKIDDFLFDKPLLLIGEDGANLINRSTPIAFIARGQYWVNNHAHVIDGTTEGFLRYIELHINAIDLKPYLTGTAQPKMNQARMNAIRIALPPEREQLRILAKVDELMSLCDELEAALASAQDGRARLLGVLLHQALEDLALPKLIGTGTGG